MAAPFSADPANPVKNSERLDLMRRTGTSPTVARNPVPIFMKSMNYRDESPGRTLGVSGPPLGLP